MQRKNLRVCIYIFKVVNNVLNTDIYILNHLFIYLLFIFLTHHIIISTLHWHPAVKLNYDVVQNVRDVHVNNCTIL